MMRDQQPPPSGPRTWEVVPMRPFGWKWRVSLRGEVWGPWTFAWTYERGRKKAARMIARDRERKGVAD